MTRKGKGKDRDKEVEEMGTRKREVLSMKKKEEGRRTRNEERRGREKA
jgi:hypothetical protein